MDQTLDPGENPVQSLQKYFIDLEIARSQELFSKDQKLELKRPRKHRCTKNPAPYSNTRGEEESTFHKFLELPKEVRLLIWEAVCNEPQVIPVKMERKQMPWLRPSLKNGRTRRKRAHKILFGGLEIKRFLTACSRHSAILTVNHEARKIGLKFYTAVNLVGPGHRPVMANLNIDYLAPVERRCTSLESLELSLQALRCIMKPKKLHRVAIPWEIWEGIDRMLNDKQSRLANMQCFFDMMKRANDITDIMLLAEGRVFSTRKSIGVRNPKLMNTWLYYQDLRGSEFKVRGPEVTIVEREQQLRSSIERARAGWRIQVDDNASKLYRLGHAASPAGVLHSYRNSALGWEIPNFLIRVLEDRGEFDREYIESLW